MRRMPSTACAPSQSAPFQAQPPHGKRNGAASGDKRLCAVGDHAAAILCGVSRLSLPRCRIVVLCGNVEAKEGRRPGSSAGLYAAQLTLARVYAVVNWMKIMDARHRIRFTQSAI